MSNLLYDDNFVRNMLKAKERGEKKEFVNYVTTSIASYFKKEYEIDTDVESIELDDKLEKGVASIHIPTISQDFMIPFTLDPEDGFALEMETGAVETKLGAQEYFISIDGEKISVKALNNIHALRKLEARVREDYPEIADELQRKCLEATIDDKITADESGMYYDRFDGRTGTERKNVVYSWNDFLMRNAPVLAREYNPEYWKVAVVKKKGKNYMNLPYDQILEVIASEVGFIENEDLKEFFSRFASEEIEQRAPKTEEEPDISVEGELTGKIEHIPSDLAVDMEMRIESDKIISSNELNKSITERIAEKLDDINSGLYIDNLLIELVKADKKKRSGSAKVIATISDPENFSVDLGFDATIHKNGSVEVEGAFDLLKGYYGLSEYKIPLNDNEYKVEASSKLEGIKKVLNHMIETDREDYTFEGLMLIPANVDFVANKIFNAMEDDIEVLKSYNNVFEGGDKESPWEVKESDGEKYLHKLYKAREVK